MALLVIASALALDAACWLLYARFQHLADWHGLYCALANAVTLGGDVSPTTAGGWIVNAAECLTVVPLFAGALSLFTSGLTATHVRDSEKRIREHITTTADGGKKSGSDAPGQDPG